MREIERREGGSGEREGGRERRRKGGRERKREIRLNKHLLI